MAYHYSDLGMPSEHLTEHFPQDYPQQFIVPSREGEYEARSSVLVDGGDRFGVSAVVFDKSEELIWMGNKGGHVTSYYGHGMQKYTSFQVHESEEVRDIITLEQGIFALTKTTLRHQIRRGIPKQTYKSNNMKDMQCLFQVSPHKFLMGGHQDKLIDLDINTMKETVIKIPEEGCVVLRSGGASLVACGSANGMVALRDIRCPGNAEHKFRAHTACLSDLDMQGDHLISCGFTQSNSVAVPEPYVLVWDVRRVGAGWSIPLGWSPLLLHFLPAVSGRAVALAEDGNVALLHVNESQDVDCHSAFQVDTHRSPCNVMDVSSTSQALVFGDQAGHLHLFSPQHNHEPVFNNFSRATEFADPLPDLPTVSMSDTAFKFSTVSLPDLTTGTKWFNELPPEFYKKVYRKPKPLDPEVIESMKMQGPIGYAPNPKNCRRNQVRLLLKFPENAKTANACKLLIINTDTVSEMPYVADNLEDLKAKQNDANTNMQPIPRHYQKLDLHYNKHGPNEEIEKSNKTGLPGLEATLPNSYCNSMLQVLYYILPLKTTLLAHTCAKEFCLSCELGFLFRMLDTSGGTPCQATNFLRAFRTVPEAAALGLILPDGGIEHKADLVTLIQSWIRFILHQIHYEILETRKKEKELVFLAQNVSPPKISQISSKICRQVVNGQYAEDYQYSELEFLGTSEYEEVFSFSVEDGWQSNNHDESMENHVTPKENHEVPNNHTTEREESEISKLFAISRQQLNRCLKCNKEEERESVVLACALQYGGNGVSGGKEERGFAELVQGALSARRSTPAWCEQCSKFTPTTQRGRLLRLPPILAINCGGITAQEKAYWGKGVHRDMPEASKRGAPGKPCRYGLHCARPGCRFKHPESYQRPGKQILFALTQIFEKLCQSTFICFLDAWRNDLDASKCAYRALSSYSLVSSRPSSAQSNVKSPTPDSCQLPHQLLIRLQSDGDVIINDKTDQSPTEHKELKSTKKLVPQCDEEYTLSAVVACVEDSPKNLVAYVLVPDKDGDTSWYLFNDLSILQVSAEEVVKFGFWWKAPCVLFYTSARAGHVLRDSDS